MASRSWIAGVIAAAGFLAWAAPLSSQEPYLKSWAPRPPAETAGPNARFAQRSPAYVTSVRYGRYGVVVRLSAPVRHKFRVLKSRTGVVLDLFGARARLDEPVTAGRHGIIESVKMFHPKGAAQDVQRVLVRLSRPATSQVTSAARWIAIEFFYGGRTFRKS